MPTYVFICSDCGYTKEEYLSISNRNQKQECPECKKDMVRAIGSGSGFYLKGKGFYKEGWNIGGKHDK